MIIALVAGLVLVAVPLYLWRRPDPNAVTDEDTSAVDGGGVVDGAVNYVPLVDSGTTSPKVKLSPFKTIRCQDPGPGRTAPERCDHITFFEEALATAIRENVLCAPSTKEGAQVSFVMEIDFRKKKRNIYHGKSSNIARNKTEQLFNCVTRNMPTPDWGTIPHQHAKYVVNVIATYPPSDVF